MASEIVLDDRALVPAIAQDATTGQVLTLAYMNAESLRRTRESGQAWFYSRSRKELWHKGATSGHYLNIRSIQMDCDGDAILLQVDPTGPACHTGEMSCFHQDIEEELIYTERTGPGVLSELAEVLHQRNVERPAGSYSAKLFAQGTGKVGQKVIEEAGETVAAALVETDDRLANEAADLFYHTLALLEARGVSPDKVWKVLEGRRK